MKTPLIILFIALLLCGCNQRIVVHDPFMDAESQIQSQLTNDVVGYSRTISLNVERQSEDPREWTAVVTVEFVNKVGGIERTNLPYRCYQTNVWAVDSRKLFDQAMK